MANARALVIENRSDSICASKSRPMPGVCVYVIQSVGGGGVCLCGGVCVFFFANQIFHLPCAYNRRRIASDDDDADADTVADNDGCGRTLIEAPSACIVVAQFRFISGVRAGERTLARPLPTTRIAIVPMRQPSSVPAPTKRPRRMRADAGAYRFRRFVVVYPFCCCAPQTAIRFINID